MEINLADYVGKSVIVTLRNGSILSGKMTGDNSPPFVYELQERRFRVNGKWFFTNQTCDRDIISISLVDSYDYTVKDLLELLATLTDSSVMKPPFHIRKKDNGDFVLSVLESVESDLGSRWQITNTVVFSKEGEATAKGSTTLYDLVNQSKKEKALAKLTAEDREVLGL